MSELTKLQENVAGWWVQFRMAKDEEGCRKALNGAINDVFDEAINAIRNEYKLSYPDHPVSELTKRTIKAIESLKATNK